MKAKALIQAFRSADSIERRALATLLRGLAAPKRQNEKPNRNGRLCDPDARSLFSTGRQPRPSR